MGKAKNGVNLLLVPGFFIFSAGFLLQPDARPFEMSWLLKVLPIVCLALLAGVNRPEQWLLPLGLVFSGAGDILLELAFDGLFEAGVAAFIFAHLCYIALFIRWPLLTPFRGLVMGGILIFGFSFGIMLFPFLGPMTFPVLVYLGVILAMAVSACLGRRTNAIIILGAVLFLLSDALIAYTRFVAPVGNASFWIMLSYYLAQSLITSGTLMMPSQK